MSFAPKKRSSISLQTKSEGFTPGTGTAILGSKRVLIKPALTKKNVFKKFVIFHYMAMFQTENFRPCFKPCLSEKKIKLENCHVFPPQSTSMHFHKPIPLPPQPNVFFGSLTELPEQCLVVGPPIAGWKSLTFPRFIRNSSVNLYTSIDPLKYSFPSCVMFVRSFFKDWKLARLFILHVFHVLPHKFQKLMVEFEKDIRMSTY